VLPAVPSHRHLLVQPCGNDFVWRIVDDVAEGAAAVLIIVLVYEENLDAARQCPLHLMSQAVSCGFLALRRVFRKGVRGGTVDRERPAAGVEEHVRDTGPTHHRTRSDPTRPADSIPNSQLSTLLFCARPAQLLAGTPFAGTPFAGTPFAGTPFVGTP